MTDIPEGQDDAAAPGSGSGAGYQVLARKYRPQTFDDLIGHEAMVRALRNAFASGRIAHAYILTGVRGVGKTTTARILARALNYAGPNGEDAGPTIDMPGEGLHCRAIAESRHPDVLEMDAASRTGVGDIRELIEGVRYAPSEARYKVYIIDEVHMLSTAAFNALLKTLEEPPPHVKFIFATTEIRKVPVTVLSRCQRFDLRRVEPETLTDHLAKVAEKEGVAIDRESLWMIARAAEGSVRDALSLLDQAIVQGAAGEGGGPEAIRAMLGLADRSRSWELLHAALSGAAGEALGIFREQYDAGADPAVILRDLLELVHLVSRVKAAGPEAAGHGAAGEADAGRARETADRLSMNALTRAWSLLMKGLSETREAPDPAAAGEMALIRLCYAADLPTPDEALRMLKGSGERRAAVGNRTASAASIADSRSSILESAPGGRAAAAGGGFAREPLAAREDPQPAPAPRRAPAPRGDASGPRLSSFEDVIRLAEAKRDAKLRIELESYVHLISFAEGRIAMRLHERAPADLAGRLTRRLKEWTGAHWVATVDSNAEGAPTIRDARYAEVMAHPMVKRALALFPGAEITAIRDVEPASDASDMAPPDPDEDDER
ncbi:DNA polymerase III subunit gamma/tau [Amphiplicatus metriothermophilus]|uniref:DNA polymerase III subunit gamma/tau n=1 Tax=Amphiplicatus metriothermophilus TaxID=1519374 RepID=A0A239PK72_9PROT|nr:DNA polymerase III subunit gamma/tau [Amphiplicatus metriothermophilus]MBB5517457.1 DNA polymerase-3 subunit gamma/tau [Amphiplicatus metriothermophilus]SNT68208.1 DNA polymerase-3 subunit gamma/tau [Amphiplicatus metriothermophilus]